MTTGRHDDLRKQGFCSRPTAVKRAEIGKAGQLFIVIPSARGSKKNTSSRELIEKLIF
jgi:hypothetical protein